MDKTISKAALSKFSEHLWYLTDKVAILSLFDDEVSKDIKTKMVRILTKENVSNSGKRYIPSNEELCSSLYGKFDLN